MKTSYSIEPATVGKPCWLAPHAVNRYCNTQIKPYIPYLCVNTYDRGNERMISILATADGEVIDRPYHDFIKSPCKYHLFRHVKAWSSKHRIWSRPMQIIAYSSEGYTLSNNRTYQYNQLTDDVSATDYTLPLPEQVVEQRLFL